MPTGVRNKGLFAPALPGRGGKAQSGGGAGGGPLTSIGIDLRTARNLGLACPCNLWIMGDFSEAGVGDIGLWLSVSLDAAEGDGRLEIGKRGDFADLVVNFGEIVHGERLDV